jgi:sugar transferase (PEP-CTERM/EpsH1 system associated)
MQELLFLAHRIPYPPDKGDKIRSWNFLAHLARRYRVHLGCFIDDPRDWQFTDVLRGICQETCFVPLDPRLARMRSLRALLDGRPLTLAYYLDKQLMKWVDAIVARPALTRAFAYCSAMAQYLPNDGRGPTRRIADIVDVDSEKWRELSQHMHQPKRWLFNRESARLRQVEQQIAAAFDATIVATSAEMTLLRESIPAAHDRVVHVTNGVDCEYFSPERAYENPYGAGVTALAFIGAMDYWPNIDAVTHFARDILPRIRLRISDARFFIVGSNPSREVLALAEGPDVVVTGRVPDVRPFVAHARIIVAPLRIARGVQNKVLEGMAMARPVVCSPSALAGISATPNDEVFCADGSDDFAHAVCIAATTDEGTAVGRRARRRILADYGWPASLRRLDAIVDGRDDGGWHGCAGAEIVDGAMV